MRYTCLYLLLPLVNKQMKNPIGMNAVRFKRSTAFPSPSIVLKEGERFILRNPKGLMNLPICVEKLVNNQASVDKKYPNKK